jgi:hypothetical protein
VFFTRANIRRVSGALAFILDGEEYLVPGVPGVTAVATPPEPNTIRAEGKINGRIAGQASYVVSTDGTTLTARVSGMDGPQRPFKRLWYSNRQ